jgi:hypothetical protein
MADKTSLLRFAFLNLKRRLSNWMRQEARRDQQCYNSSGVRTNRDQECAYDSSIQI